MNHKSNFLKWENMGNIKHFNIDGLSCDIKKENPTKVYEL